MNEGCFTDITTTILAEKLGEHDSCWATSEQENIASNLWSNTLDAVNSTSRRLDKYSFEVRETMNCVDVPARVFAILGECTESCTRINDR